MTEHASDLTDEAMLVELTDVTRCYGGDDGRQTQVLRGISLKIRCGDSLAILGPSGSGKSTLLNILGGLDRPTSGRVVLDGADLSSLDPTELARVRSRTIGFVFQSHHLLPQCTALENVLVPTLATGDAGGAETQARARRLLEQVGLADRMTHRPGQLSGGECQRVAVVRALINEPKIVLADEPTGSLDGAAATGVVELLVELNSTAGRALVVVTHAESVADRMNRTLTIEDGRLDGAGSPA